jgi:carboxypeptidase family protein/TonB-dependent receptor-like protein
MLSYIVKALRGRIGMLISLLGFLCFADGLANIHGIVRTENGIPLANARVSARAAGENTEHSAITDQRGMYRMQGVVAGPSILSVRLPASTTSVETRCDARRGQDSQCDIVVSAQAAVANGGIIDSETVRDLPVNGRDVQQATTLQAGVSAVQTQQSASDTNSGRGQRGFGQQISLAGARPQQNNYLLDGITTNDYANSAPGSVLGLNLGADAVEQLAVNTGSYPAQFGRSSGGVVQAVTRSGSNAFHGSVYEFVRNSAAEARAYFDTVKPPFRRNQFGAAAAAPLWRNRTYIFGNYEGLRQSLGLTQVDTVPSAATRQGALPSMAPYLGLYPLPNGGLFPGGETGIFRFSGQHVTHEDYFTSRADHTIDGNDKLTGTYVFDRANTVEPDQLDFKLNGIETRRHLLSLTESHVFSATTALSSRLGINRVEALTGQTPGAIDPKAADTSLGFVPGLTVGGLNVVGLSTFTGGLDAPNKFSFHWTSLQWYTDATLKRGRHRILLGAAVERMRGNMSTTNQLHGVYTFESIDDFLMNRPFSLNLELPGSDGDRGLRQTVLGSYAQDDVHVSSALTLNLGLRYELASVPVEQHGRLAALRQIQDPLLHLGNPYFSNPTRLNFEPRAGLAWSPLTSGRLVVRSGFGIFDVLPLPYEFEILSLVTAPYFRLATIPVSLLPPGSFPGGGVRTAESGNSPRRTAYIEPDPHRNYVMQWNLGVEGQMARNASLSLVYVGSRGVHQPFRVDDMNMALPAYATSQGYFWPSPAKSGQKLNPTTGRLNGLMWGGDSYYEALQTQARAVPFLGLQLQAAYTWGKSIDTGSSTINGNQFLNSISTLPWFDLHLNRGLSDFNITQNFTLHFTWPLPAPGFGPKAVRALGSGWQFGGTYHASSGVPFTVLVGGDPLGQNSTDPIDVPDRLQGPGCSTSVNDPHAISYVNLNCLKFPSPSLRRGNLGRNSLIGPGLENLDVSLHKDSIVRRVSDRLNVQFRVDAFNLFNHPNFAPPLSHQVIYGEKGNVVPGGGLIDTTQTPPRQVQVGLKLIW